ncbi:hypothetical protein [Flavisericum labens]|uniref:hypothetical protein n=1 Tax=Flavisericum labens TaxID=3377112 RepID=UPI00387B7BE8
MTEHAICQNADKIGEVEIMFSIPYVNNFYSQPEGETNKSGIGFWGVSGSVGYQYSKNKFASIVFSNQMEYEVPVPMGIDYIDGILEDQYSSNISLINNHNLKKFIIGYGLSYTWYTWRIRYFGEDYMPPNQIGKSVSNQSLGLNLNTYYKIGRHLNIGIVYRPDFFMVNPSSKLKYQHSISLDFCWRWRISKKKS